MGLMQRISEEEPDEFTKEMGAQMGKAVYDVVTAERLPADTNGMTRKQANMLGASASVVNMARPIISSIPAVTGTPELWVDGKQIREVKSVDVDQSMVDQRIRISVSLDESLDTSERNRKMVDQIVGTFERMTRAFEILGPNVTAA